MATTAVAVPATVVTLAELPASVVQPPGARVAVTAPFAGIVQSVHVQPGQVVARGQLLAVLFSREASALAAELAQAQARQRLAEAEAARLAELARAGIIAASRADTAALAGTEARIAATSARTLLGQTGTGRDGRIRLTAPIAGRIASVGLDAGTAVDGLGAPIVIEAESSRWLALQVPEQLASQLRPGLPVVTAQGQQGQLETVGSSIDPATRAVPARARLAVGGPPLASGQLLRLFVRAPAPPGAASVPAAALLHDNGRDVLFVRRGNGFAMRFVTRVGVGDPAVIAAGVTAGETVATSHLPELRAAAQP